MSQSLTLGLFLLMALGPSAVILAGGKPDPYQQTDRPFIGPSPVPVMEQVFWVQLPLPPEIEVSVSAPEGVKFLDRTKPGKGRPFTRLYFRSDRGIADGKLLITPAGGQPITLPLKVLTYRQDIEEKIREVKGVDPKVRKRGRSYYTNDMIALAKSNLARFPELATKLKRASLFDKMPDAQIFAFLPSWNVPRQCYSNWPCPFCGEKIYAKNAFYPWQPGAPGSFKCVCPICKKTFPTNDITKDDFTSGEYPDDGWGCNLGQGLRGKYAGWVAYHNHQSLWLPTGEEMKRLAERYLLLGEEAAAHKVALLLARLAFIYPGMDTTWQQVDDRYLRSGRILVDGAWERMGLLAPACQAYDAIFDYVDKDTQLVKFLQTKDPSIQSPDDVKALIETYLIQVFGWDWIDRRLSGGSQGARERDLAYMAVCADMGKVTERWIEELFTHAYSGGINRGGYDDENLINTLNRDGTTLVCGFGYATLYLSRKSDMAEILSRVTSPQWKARCNLYDPKRYPKFRAEFDTWPQMLVAGHHVPCYGDHGSPVGETRPNGALASLRMAYARAYRRWPTDDLARTLHRMGPSPPELFEEDVWPRVEAHVQKIGPAPPLESRVLDGTGFVFLESRPHAAKIEQRAGIALRYGPGLGHHHCDNLNVEMWAHDTAVAPELGYPCWAHPMGATGHTVHHNTGMIDRRRQYEGAVSRGTLEMFASAPEASFADVSAAPSGFPSRLYRRAVCLADAPNGNVYLLDIFRMAGGALRTYCFHGPGHKAFESNLNFGPKSPEPFSLPQMSRHLSNNVIEPQTATSDGDVWADWTHDQKDLHMRLDILGRPGRRYTTARYARPDSPPIRFFFSEDEGRDGASEFVAIWQPYMGRPFVERVERLRLEHEGPSGEFGPSAIRVHLAGGQTDTFLYSPDVPITIHCEGIEFRGHFGYWSERNGQFRCLHLVNGTRLLKNGVGVCEAPPPFKARISRVDLAENILALDAKLPTDGSLKGQLAYIRGGKHRTAYSIAEVLPQENEIRLELNGILFRSKMETMSADKSFLVTELSPPIEARRGFRPGYYDDALLTGEDLRARYRVKKVEGDKIFSDRPLKPDDFPDADGDGRRMVCIYDVGPGDEVTMYNSVFIRVEDGKAVNLGRAELKGIAL